MKEKKKMMKRSKILKKKGKEEIKIVWVIYCLMDWMVEIVFESRFIVFQETQNYSRYKQKSRIELPRIQHEFIPKSNSFDCNLSPR